MINQIKGPSIQATIDNIAKKTAAMILVIPANPTSTLIAALVFEGVEPLDVLDPFDPGVTEGLLEVLVGLGGRE
jgi:hypothetical protein